MLTWTLWLTLRLWVQAAERRQQEEAARQSEFKKLQEEARLRAEALKKQEEEVIAAAEREAADRLAQQELATLQAERQRQVTMDVWIIQSGI